MLIRCARKSFNRGTSSTIKLIADRWMDFGPTFLTGGIVFFLLIGAAVRRWALVEADIRQWGLLYLWRGRLNCFFSRIRWGLLARILAFWLLLIADWLALKKFDTYKYALQHTSSISNPTLKQRGSKCSIIKLRVTQPGPALQLMKGKSTTIWLLLV
jgi:hypothetical protein